MILTKRAIIHFRLISKIVGLGEAKKSAFGGKCSSGPIDASAREGDSASPGLSVYTAVSRGSLAVA